MTSRTHTPEDVQKIMEPWRDSASDYERGFIDGMQKQMQSSVDKAVNAMTQPTDYIPNKHEHTWVGLTEQEQGAIMEDLNAYGTNLYQFARAIEYKLKEKNNG
jgi:hypothetical protein